MTKSELKYLGSLRTQLTHLKSGKQVITDAPTDNNGKGEAFSPTDLIAAGLLSCMVTIMGIQADKRGIEMGEVSGSVEKYMLDNPRRIGRLKVVLHLSGTKLTDAEKKILENAARNCPVAKSISPEIAQEVEFKYEL